LYPLLRHKHSHAYTLAYPSSDHSICHLAWNPVQKPEEKNMVLQYLAWGVQLAPKRLLNRVLVCTILCCSFMGLQGVGCLGQLGIGAEKTERKKPTLVGIGQVAGSNSLLDGKNVVAVVAGGMHSAVITADGEVYTSGCNDEGALGRTLVETEEDDSPEFSIGLAMGLEGQQVVAGSAGDSHTFVLTADGKVFGAGTFRDPSGSFGFSDTVLEAKHFLQVYPSPTEEANGTDGFAPAIQIASGVDHVVILTEDPKSKKTTVLTCGSADQGQLGRIGANKCARDAPCVDPSQGFTPTPVHFLAYTFTPTPNATCIR
jgi:alpha-tubulin suppressor-like RCC1 family protein